MIKNILNLGDAAVYCDFGKEVNQKINQNVIKYFKNIKDKKIECEDLEIKIDEVIKILTNHPFVISNRKIANEIANFRVFSLL